MKPQDSVGREPSKLEDCLLSLQEFRDDIRRSLGVIEEDLHGMDTEILRLQVFLEEERQRETSR